MSVTPDIEPEPTAERSTRRTLLSGGGWGLFAQLAPLLINIVLTPYVIRGFGLSRYGLYLLVSALVSFLATFDGGLGSTSARFLSVLAGRGAVAESTRLLCTVCLIIVSIAVPLSVGLWFLAPALTHLTTMPDSLRGEAVFLFRTLISLVALGIIRSILNSAIYAHQRFAAVTLIDTGIYLVYVVGIVLSVSEHWGLRGLAVTFIVMQGLSVIGILPILRRYVTRAGVGLLSRPEIREFFGYAAKLQIVSISALVNNEVDSLVIGAILPVREVGLFQSGANFSLQLRGFLMTALTPTVTVFGRTLGREGREQLDRQFARLQTGWVRIVTGWTAAGVGAIWFGITAWLGPRFDVSGVVAAITFVGGSCQLLVGALYVYLEVVGLPGLQARYAICSMATNIVLTIPLAFLGILGVAAATGVAGIVSMLYLLRIIARHEQLDLTSVLAEIPVLPALVTLGTSVGLELLVRPLIVTGALGLLMSAIPGGVALMIYAVMLMGPRPALRAARQFPAIVRQPRRLWADEA